MGHQRVRRQRQRFVEDEQGDEVVGERDPHGGRDGDREAGVEPRLVLLVVRPHVSDGVDGRDEPQEPRHHREQHAERLHHQLQRNSRHQGSEDETRPAALRNLGVDPEHAREHERRGDQGHRLPEIGAPPCKHDESAREQRQGEACEHQKRGSHRTALGRSAAVTGPVETPSFLEATRALRETSPGARTPCPHGHWWACGPLRAGRPRLYGRPHSR